MPCTKRGNYWLANARDNSGQSRGATDAVRGRVGGAFAAKAKGLAKSLAESLDVSVLELKSRLKREGFASKMKAHAVVSDQC